MRKRIGRALSVALAMSMAFTMTPIQSSAKEVSDLEESEQSVMAEGEPSDTLSYEGYEEVWKDEFDGTELDRTSWNVEKHEKGWVNSELQEYVDSEKDEDPSKRNIIVNDGKLTIHPIMTEETIFGGGGNLLENYDFSDGITGWSETIANWGGDYVADASSKTADGAITYTIANPGTEAWHVQLKQMVKLEAGQKYIFTYKVKSDVARKIYTGVQGDATNGYLDYGKKDFDLEAGKETTVSIEVCSEDGFDNAALYFSLGKESGDETPDASVVTFSDVALYKVPENVLENADFAKGIDSWSETIANWGGDYVTDASSKIADGAITYTIANPGTELWHVQLKQLVDLTAGQKYIFSYKVKSDVSRMFYSGVQGDATNEYKGYGGKDFVLEAGKEETVSVEVCSEEGFQNAALYFSMGRVAADAEVTPDASVVTISDISLTPVVDITKPAASKTKVSYTSGRISTQNLKPFTYGLFEVSAKVPEGKGYLPAFWLMSNDENVYGQWPRCGEIDCMEVMGQDPTKVYGTIHYGNPHSESQGTYVTGESEKNFAEDFHKYTCEWLPGRINWYIDGKLFHTEDDWYSTTEGQGTLSYPAPFDQPFYVILNLAVGGSWVTNPDEHTFDANNDFVIDYVKVMQKDDYNDADLVRPEKPFEDRTDIGEDGNYIVNGDFATAEALDDNKDWVFLNALGGEGTATIADNEIKVVTTTDGTDDYAIQLLQANIPLEKGYTYKFSFDAKAAEERTMNVDVKAPDRGYKKYMSTKNPALTGEFQNFEYEFVMSQDSDTNARVEFNMGNMGSTADVEIKNVKFVKTDKAIDESVINPPKTVLANGNYIYNGKFQEGTNHLGEWTVAPAASASVSSFSDGRRLNVTASTAVPTVISQEALAFTAGSPYEFSFDAKAEAPTTVEVVVGGYKQVISVAASTTPKTYTFKIPDTAVFSNKNVSMKFTGPVSIDNVMLAEAALIKNGSFDNGLTGFEVYVDSSAKASYVVDSLQEDNALDVTIDNTSDQDWKIQIKQNDVLLEKGKTYKLQFDAKSSMDREIRAIMQGHTSQDYYPVYSNDNIVALTSEFQTFTDTFTMNEDTDPAAYLSICLGKINGVEITDQHRVVIDNISLVEVEPTQDPPKPEDPPVDPPKPEDPPKPAVVKPVTVTYATHIQSIGNQDARKDGVVAGTTGLGKRLENIKIKVDGNPNLGIQYTTHCQSYGWMNWSANNEVNGTSGEAKRLEAIEIKLTGADKDKYDVYYRVHAQSYGWLAWAKNGAPAGTAGLAKRLEAIQVVVVKKGEIVPDTFKNVKSQNTKAYIAGGKNPEVPTISGADSVHVQYRTHVQSYGWQTWRTDGKTAGTSGEKKRLEALNIELKNKDYTGGICYNTHVQSFGWQASTTDSTKWAKDGAISGTSGKAKRLEAIQIKLYGEMAEHYDVYYRVHAQSFGWMNWAKNGEVAGTEGLAKRLEAIQIVLVPKGGKAPAATYEGATTNNVKAFIKK